MFSPGAGPTQRFKQRKRNDKNAYIEHFIDEGYCIDSITTDHQLEAYMPDVCKAFGDYPRAGSYVLRQFRRALDAKIAANSSANAKELQLRADGDDEKLWHAIDGNRQVSMKKNGQITTTSTQTKPDGTTVTKICEHPPKRTVDHYFTMLDHEDL